jgi:hypothetical protein
MTPIQRNAKCTPPAESNFDWLFGAGIDLLDSSFDEAIREQSVPDQRMWQ